MEAETRNFCEFKDYLEVIDQTAVGPLIEKQVDVL